MVKALDTAKINWDEALRVGNQWYDRINKANRNQDRHQRAQALEQFEAELKSLAKRVQDEKTLKKVLTRPKQLGKLIGEVLVTLLLPAVSAAQSAEDRSIQISRNLHVAFALAAYHGDHGRYPKRLGLLAPKYLKTIPSDLFAGKPLQYRVTPKGYLLYSVGRNGKDEGGRWYDDKPPGDDPRVRMPAVVK